MLYGISHGFDITHNFLVMDWHFKDILLYYYCIGHVHVSYRMYALCITLCVTAGGNAFPQPQRRLRIWYYDLVLEDFISLIDVFSDVFWRGTASHHEIIINLCVSHFG